jgi:cephalosporin hydroxylase
MEIKMGSLIGNEFRRLQGFFNQTIFTSIKIKKNIIDHFHRLYYESGDQTWKNTFWLGIQTEKCPLDLWIYQEIIFEIRPDVIIESGTYNGGSALFLASLCDLMGKGQMISIDIERKENRPKHDRIIYLLGSSTSKEITEAIQNFIRNNDQVLVILDSDHNKDHVLRELEIYSQFVTKGSYIIVEDTNINGHPVDPEFGPGPREAVEEFLEKNNNFIIDGSREKFYLTFDPGGYLKRIK